MITPHESKERVQIRVDLISNQSSQLSNLYFILSRSGKEVRIGKKIHVSFREIVYEARKILDNVYNIPKTHNNSTTSPSCYRRNKPLTASLLDAQHFLSQPPPTGCFPKVAKSTVQ